MLQKIENKSIISVWDAENKYLDKHFIFVITTRVDTQQQDLGYVAYIADTEDELYKLPREEFSGLVTLYAHGLEAELDLQIGGITFV